MFLSLFLHLGINLHVELRLVVFRMSRSTVISKNLDQNRIDEESSLNCFYVNVDKLECQSNRYNTVVKV
jgi:hypothetical protein